MTDLKEKKILVTGSSSGIGRAIAIECAKQGALVVVHYRKNEAGAKETLAEVEKHSKGIIVLADLTEKAQVDQLFQSLESQGYGNLDLLVNNAGEATSGAFDDFSLWEAQWKNIFISQVFVADLFLKKGSTDSLRKIVNISSVYGDLDMGNPDFFQYSAAKAAVNSLTCNLAKKYAPKVLVNAVAPGYVWTPAWEGTSEEEKKDCEDLTKIKRFVTPEEIAQTVVTLLENDAITGEIIRVDGGLHLLNLR